jgi:MFS family permease
MCRWVIRSGDAPTPCQKSSAKWVLAATILGSSLAFIDGTVVNVALPALQRDLQATVIGVQWVVEAYSLLLAALLLVGGSLGDRYGRRRIFVIGVVLFAAASAACGFAGGIGTLIAARALQGIWFQEASPLSIHRLLTRCSFSTERRLVR